MITKEQLQELVTKEYTKKQVSRELNIGYSTVYWYMSKYGLTFSNVESNRKVDIQKCATCGDTDSANFYGGRKIQCKNCFNKQCAEKQKETKLRAVEYKGGCCQHCGYNKSISALEFHHMDPIQKDPQYKATWSWKRLKPELDKCILLCSNCHREEHDRIRLIN
jgi:hypothetical protein